MSSAIHSLRWLWNRGAHLGQESNTTETKPNNSNIAKHGELILCALPALRQLSMDLAQHFGQNDKRRDCFNDILSTVTLLENYIGRIKKENCFLKFDEAIIELADCLEDLFAFLQVADSSDAENVSDGLVLWHNYMY
ncbi:hypothetical protein CFAM422_000177 [Trichoderma lentiforme]|uniref:Uncharacterized protein n=1 Tax=Trichoderma lentiforme TaxID=1567552 RepID=A0A9P4XRH8_9HYPO|nr:hypothetical protein CFAM422_000177 [Trichoderma lentiforme]